MHWERATQQFAVSAPFLWIAIGMVEDEAFLQWAMNQTRCLDVVVSALEAHPDRYNKTLRKALSHTRWPCFRRMMGYARWTKYQATPWSLGRDVMELC